MSGSFRRHRAIGTIRGDGGRGGLRLSAVFGAVLAALGGALGVAAAVAVASSPAQALEAAIVYDLGLKFDKSFNESAYQGVVSVRRALGVTVHEYELMRESDRATALEGAAARADLVIGIGFGLTEALSQTAAAHPERRFTIVDDELTAPNVQSIRFRDNEGSFLVGILAGLASQTGTVGFVGGMDSSGIHRFRVGFEHGVHYVRPEIKVLSAMIGPTAEAFVDPMAGYLLARAQVAAGADVVFAAAGSSGFGVYEAAREAARLAIGVDANQNYLFPGTLLTSMVKRVDVAVEYTVRQALAGAWLPGVVVLGVGAGGVGWSLDRYNRTLITREMTATVDAAAREITAGRLAVADVE